MGAYTAARVMVMAMIGPTSSRAACKAASYGPSPSCMCRSTFSTTTMASSTTSPTASTMASRVNRFNVNPKINMMNRAPMSEIGIATTGISTERRVPRNKKMTTTTMPNVSMSVWTTSLIAFSMYLVESYGMPTFMPTGSWRSMSGMSLRTSRITSSELAVGSTQTPMNVARSPSKRTSAS